LAAEKLKIMWVGASEAVSELDESLVSGARRPEGPANNRPDRKVGIRHWNENEPRRGGTQEILLVSLYFRMVSASNHV